MLSVVNRAVSPNNTLPVLNNILIRAEGKKVSFFATNLEIAISASLDAQIQNEGSLTIPSKSFSSYIGLIQDSEVSISTSGNTLIIESTGSHTDMKGISSEEFPLVPKLKDPVQFKMPTEGLQHAIDMVVFAASTNISRPILTGVYVQIEGTKVKLAATDSYRLAEKTLHLKQDSGVDLSFVLPSRTAAELSRILGASSEEGQMLEISLSKGQVLFKLGAFEMISRLIEGNYPDYEKILPKESKMIADLNTEEFILGLKKVSVIVREGNNNVRTSVGSGRVRISSDETQVGKGDVEIPVDAKGESVEASLNVQYLLDVLSHLNSDRVHFSLNDSLSPVKVTPVSESDYMHIIMPLKV